MRKQMPFFSVVIPVYNKVTTLARTLRSVFNQSYADFEVIAIDDGSSDGSLLVLQDFAAKYSKLRVVSQQNSGVSVARNRGVQESNGEWIAFLDADDVWLSKFLEVMHRLIESCPKARMVGSNFYILQARKIFCMKNSFRDGYIDFFRWWTPQKIPFHTSGHCIRRDVFLEVGGYNERLSFYEDAELMFRVAFANAVAATPQPLAVYTDDSRERASKVKPSGTLLRWPHIDLIEKMCKVGTLSDAQLNCGRAYVLSALGDGILSSKRRSLICAQFPNIYRRLPLIFKLPLVSSFALFARRAFVSIKVRFVRHYHALRIPGHFCIG